MSESTATATALCVTFVTHAPQGATVEAIPGESRRIAVIRPIAFDELPTRPVDRAIEDELHVLCLPGGAATSPEELRRAQAWVGAETTPADQDRPAELLLQSDRIVWRPGCALLVGPGGLDEYLPGLLTFSYLEGELRRLENEIEEWWPTAEQDTDLTHQVNARSLKRWEHVNGMTRSTTAARMRWGAISGPLDRPGTRMPALSRRLAAELAVHAETTARLALVDDRLEILCDLYELANDRLSEYRYFRSEAMLEWLIVAMLAVEAVLLLIDYL